MANTLVKQHGADAPIEAAMAAEKTLFPRRWYGGMISANLEVIWEMSVQRLAVWA